MKIIYTEHIKRRLVLRNIDHDLPRRVYEQSAERYFDRDTGHFIAIMRATMYDKDRDMLVAYVVEGEQVKLLTIHPLKAGQKEDRIRSGRWRKI